MNITFTPLSESHFPLLLKWLEAPHVKKWWDRDVIYTPDLVKEKFGDYVKEYKVIKKSSLRGGRKTDVAIQENTGSPRSLMLARDDNFVTKPIEAYIICLDNIPIGYVQSYSANDFPCEQVLDSLPESLGGLDIFIGEEEYLRKGIGSEAIKKFTEKYIFSKFKYAFVDPEFKNEAAVRSYKKAGFVILRRMDNLFWMVAHKKIVRLSTCSSIALEVTFKECFLPDDRLWVFGSRVDLGRKGGDIDLYVETHAKAVAEAAERRSKFISKLEQAIGEQKIDVVLNMLEFPYPLPIHQVALAEGVRII